MQAHHSLLAVILLVLSLPVLSHGLSPSRLEAPSGSPLVAHKFTAINNYADTEQFAVQCFKGSLNNPYECKSIPQTFYVPSKKTRTFKVQIAPDEDAVYMVCTIQTKDAVMVTRVCSRFGVGKSASLPTDGNRIGEPAKHPGVPAGSRQNKGG